MEGQAAERTARRRLAVGGFGTGLAGPHHAQPGKLQELATWGFGDFCWGLEHDVVSSVAKLRLAGFHHTVDTEEQILAHLVRYREAKVLP